MRRHVLFASFILGLSPVFLTASGADAPIAEFKDSIVMLTSVRSHYADGIVIQDTMKDLQRDSPTFNEMLRILGASRVLTLISPVASSQTEAGLVGQTRFAVSPARIVATMQVVTAREDLRLRQYAIAHEFGHIVEVACLGPVTNYAELMSRLRLQLASYSDRKQGRIFETRFPDKAAKAVLDDVRQGRSGPSRLGDLLIREGLIACPLVAPGREVVIVQREEPESDSRIEDLGSRD